MAKIERGRISGFHGMETHTAEQLYAQADRLEAEVKNPDSKDDPKYLLRWAKKIRKLANQKEKALEHKANESK